MKKTCTILILLVMCGLSAQRALAQFAIVRDTIHEQVNLYPRLGDFNNAIPVFNDSVVFMYPSDVDIDPWRYVDYYTPSREVKSGYIREALLKEVDDFEIVEVERLSASGTISFKNDAVRIVFSVAKIDNKNLSVKQNFNGSYSVGGQIARGIAKGELPKLRYSNISVSFGNKQVSIPKKIYDNLFEPEIDNMVVYYDPVKETVYIEANNGGLHAYYKALFVINRQKAVNVYVFDPATK